MPNRQKRWWKLETFWLVDSVNAHVRQLNEHPERRPPELEMKFKALRGHAITTHWLTALLVFPAPDAKNVSSDARVRWNNFRVGGLFSNEDWNPVRNPDDPFDLGPTDPRLFPAEPEERKAFEAFLDGAVGSGGRRFERYLRHRMSYPLMRRVAEQAIRYLGWDPGPFWYLVDPRYKERNPTLDDEEYPNRQALHEQHLIDQIERHLEELSDHHGWDAEQLVALAAKVAARCQPP